MVLVPDRWWRRWPLLAGGACRAVLVAACGRVLTPGPPLSVTYLKMMNRDVGWMVARSPTGTGTAGPVWVYETGNGGATWNQSFDLGAVYAPVGSILQEHQPIPMLDGHDSDRGIR